MYLGDTLDSNINYAVYSMECFGQMVLSRQGSQVSKWALKTHYAAARYAGDKDGLL